MNEPRRGLTGSKQNMQSCYLTHSRIKRGNNKLPSVTKALQKVAKSRRVFLQWIPVHCGISANEGADELAKEGAHGNQSINSISYIKAIMKPKEQDSV